MPRKLATLLIASVLAIWGGAVTTAKDGPSGKDGEPSPLYYAASVGDTLVYELKVAGVSTEMVVQVDAAEKKGTVTVVSAHTTASGIQTKSDRFEVSDKGLFQVKKGDETLDPPMCLLRLPAKKGDSWEETFAGHADTKVKFTTEGEEEIEVPAGKFRAVRVGTIADMKDQIVQTTNWLAPGIGTIKSQIKIGNQEVVLLLKSFNAGKN